MIKEQAFSFGNNCHMMGIYSVPTEFDRSRPAVLLWNAGLSHRIGPQRHYVDLARQLAALGFAVFRFDLTGLGDSEARRGMMSQEQREVQDIQEAMDFMVRETGVSQFVLIGLCSGAANAHPTAVVDTRVVGMVMIDAYGYPTKKFHWVYFKKRVLRFEGWMRFIKRKWLGLWQGPNLHETFFRDFPSRDKIAVDLRQLIQRGTKMYYIYSGGVGDYYNYREQFIDMFRDVDFSDQLRLDYYSEADHLFTTLAVKNRYLSGIVQWLQAHYTRIP